MEATCGTEQSYAVNGHQSCSLLSRNTSQSLCTVFAHFSNSFKSPTKCKHSFTKISIVGRPLSYKVHNFLLCLVSIFHIKVSFASGPRFLTIKKGYLAIGFYLFIYFAYVSLCLQIFQKTCRPGLQPPSNSTTAFDKVGYIRVRLS